MLLYSDQKEATMLRIMPFLVLLLWGVGGCIWPGDRGAVYDERGWGYDEGGDWHMERRMGDDMREGRPEGRAGVGREGGGEHSGGHH